MGENVSIVFQNAQAPFDSRFTINTLFRIAAASCL
jgi:hypothetical protein